MNGYLESNGLEVAQSFCDLGLAFVASTKTQNNQDDITRAVFLAEAAVKAQPEVSMIKTHLGVAYLYSGRFEDAKAQFLDAEKIRRQENAAVPNASGLAIAYHYLQDEDQPQIWFEKALEAEPRAQDPRPIGLCDEAVRLLGGEQE